MEQYSDPACKEVLPRGNQLRPRGRAASIFDAVAKVKVEAGKTPGRVQYGFSKESTRTFNSRSSLLKYFKIYNKR